MSQTDKERMIAELCEQIARRGELAEAAYDAGEKAGYRAALEDAAKIAEEIKTDSGFQVAAAIRKLEPKG